MKIVSEVYSEVGKAAVNAGMGLIIAAMIAWLLTKEPIPWWVFPIGIIIGLVQIFVGAWLIQAANQIKKNGGQ
jgi:phosphotransferase system  glucose/maltose/N-acetylglucosamine-specific IIC component